MLLYFQTKDHSTNEPTDFSTASQNYSQDATPEIIGQFHYYPFGMQLGEGRDDLTNRYRYNGKELVGDLNLNWYDYGLRYYDPTIARWSSVDPRAEKYSGWSPYNYVNGNPIINIDPNGDTIKVNNTGYIVSNDETDNLVYLQGANGGLTHLGEVGGTIDANTILTNLLEQNTEESYWNVDPITFYFLVKTGGDWDLKNNENSIFGLANQSDIANRDKDQRTVFSFEGENLEAQDVGNLHFGAVGKANIFFGEKTLLSQAGRNQMKRGNSKPEWQVYKEETRTSISRAGVLRYKVNVLQPPYGDNPQDQRWIRAGFNWYKKNR